MLSNNLNQAIHITKQIAKEHFHQYYEPAHFLKALLNRQFDFIKELDAQDIDVFYIDEWADIRMEDYPKSSRITEPTAPSSAMESVFSEAEEIAKQFEKEEIDHAIMLMALITPGVGFTHDNLKSLPLNASEIRDKFLISNKLNGQEQTRKQNTSKSSSALQKYCIDKMAGDKAETNVSLVGRDDELKTIAEILNRKLKPHLIITGESGVGKSALMEGFVEKIINNTTISKLSSANVFQIDNGTLFAGASYKGEVEDRLQKIFNELKGYEKPILFIDDIHELFDAQQNSGIASIIKSELSKNEITFIGATSTDNHRKSVGKDDALNRRFEVLQIDEPSEALALRMVKNVIPFYEKHHDFSINTSGLKESIRLSKRYLKEKSLPDSALDLIDRTMSTLKVAKEMIQAELPKLQIRIENINHGNDEKEITEKLGWLYADCVKIGGELIQSEHEENANYSALVTNTERSEYLSKMLEQLDRLSNTQNEVSQNHLSAVVSNITGIPAGKVKTDERERLLDIEPKLKQRVIGQDHAIKIISDVILESRSGLSNPGQPIGSFFFLGPTGTGKTELAKSLADFLFGDETAIIRMDMSEFKEEHSAALLYGAPPGYVGYEEGGLLVNKIRQKPYSIVLFDEIEKAHHSVFDVFLQILDEGKLHDRLGKTGDFSNAVILFTSNIGSEFIIKSFNQEKVPESNQLLEIMSSYFRPEFLGRLTEIVPFAPINKESVAGIFDIHLKKELINLLDKLHITLEMDSDTRQELALMGFSPEYGARPIKGLIRNKLKRPLAKKIISREINNGDTVSVFIENNEIQFSNLTIADERSLL